jgi:hypothetical protein
MLFVLCSSVCMKSFELKNLTILSVHGEVESVKQDQKMRLSLRFNLIIDAA